LSGESDNLNRLRWGEDPFNGQEGIIPSQDDNISDDIAKCLSLEKG